MTDAIATQASRPTCPLCVRAARCADGSDPFLIATLETSHAVLGDNQGCPGWVVLILRDHAEHVADLSLSRQLALWRDVAVVADALRKHFGPVRLNYECLGNQVNHIHWHIIPRHANDPEPRQAVWGWPAQVLRGDLNDASRAALTRQLSRLVREQPQPNP
jgi:diadenosine tetraphosphate (Ap4A) HIT family hydrolase